jgi:hypothetical protein
MCFPALTAKDELIEVAEPKQTDGPAEDADDGMSFRPSRAGNIGQPRRRADAPDRLASS